MMTDDRLEGALRSVAETERAVRHHLSVTTESASEQARGQAAYRHAVALRKALESWMETRVYRASVVGS